MVSVLMSRQALRYANCISCITPLCTVMYYTNMYCAVLINTHRHPGALSNRVVKKDEQGNIATNVGLNLDDVLSSKRVAPVTNM